MEQPKKKQESGLAHIGLIIAAVLVVAALAFGGWYVWDKNKKDDQKASNATAQNTNQKEQKQSDPSEGGKYLVIREWGVRFELPEELRGDVEYGIFTAASGEQIANLAIKEIDQLSVSNCGLYEATGGGSGKSGGVVNIHKTSKAPGEYSKENVVSYDSDINIKSNWYYVFSMRDACFDAPDDEFARLMSEVELLADTAGRLELVEK